MREKIETALNESRILVLVVQVLLGFQYQSTFQPGFDRLPTEARYVKLGGLALMLLALALLLAPTAYHRIVEKGNLSERFLRFITCVTMPALLPFALGLGGDFYIVGDKLGGHSAGLVCAMLISAVALFFWYGLEAILARSETAPRGETAMKEEATPLKEKIKFVLTEVRVVLPGTQALLGFQFAAVLTESFDTLTMTAKYVHFASLFAIALSAILLMAPTAFHRIVERGEDTERLHTFASRMLLGAMAFLAFGIAGDVFVVVQKALHTTAFALLSGGLTLLVFYGGWFGYMLARKAEKPASAVQPSPLTLS